MRVERPLMLLVDPDVLLSVPGEDHCHRDALTAGVFDICGLKVELPRDRAGHTDYTLLRQAFATVELQDQLTEQLYTLIAEAAATRYRETCAPALGDCVLTGATAVLTELAADPRGRVLPCSGRIGPIARVLLERSGLAALMYVGYGSFGDWQVSRPDLVNRARIRAGGQFGLPWPHALTVLISCCPEDLLAARTAGVQTIAIGERAEHAGDHWLSDIAGLPEMVDGLSR